MTAESFGKLIDELKKYSGFRFPDDVKSSVNEAISQKTLKNMKFPITNSNFPVVKSISLILSNKKLHPIPQQFVQQICECIANGVFSGPALVSVSKSLELLTQTEDIDFALKLIQFTSSCLPHFSSNLHLIKSFSSLILSFLNSKNETVIQASFAAFQQMISTEFKFIQSSKMEDLSPENQQNLKILVKNGISAKFEDPLYVISFLIINDLANLTIGKQCLWLRVKQIPLNILFDLWESIISTQNQFLKRSIHMMRVIENSAIAQSPSILPMSFHCTFVRCFYSELSDTTISLFSQYSAGLSDKSDLCNTSILFFRQLLMQNPTFLLNILPENIELIGTFLDRLNDMCDMKKYSQTIDFKFQQIKVTVQTVKQNELMPLFLIETVLLTVSCLTNMNGIKDEDQEVRNQKIAQMDLVFEKLWRKIALLLFKLVRVCDKNSCEIVYRVYSNFVNAMNAKKDGQLILLRVLCSLVSQQKILRNDIDPLEQTANDFLHSNKSGFWFKGKKVFAYHLLTKLVTQSPLFFSQLYRRLFNTLAMYENSNLDNEWTKTLPDDELKNLTKALLTNSPLSIDFLNGMIFANPDRFDCIWGICSPEIPDLFENHEIEQNLIVLLKDIVTKLFSQSNEYAVLRTMSETIDVTKHKMSPGARLSLMDLFSVTMKHNGSSISSGWSFIIKSISVNNCDNSVNVLSSAFQALNSICTDHLDKLSESDMSAVIDLILTFCAQKADLNTALTSLGLYWNVISHVYKSTKFWKQILTLIMSLFSDPRNDVSSGALSTFFMLITSNSQQMPNDVLPHLLEHCLIPLLSSYTSFNDRNYGVVQHALCEIGHCSTSFWDQLDKIPSFRKTFCPLLIEKVQFFLTKCTDSDVAANCIAFYEDCLPSPVLPYSVRMDIMKSVKTLVTLFLAREQPNSLLISELGRLVQKTLPTQKNYLSNEMLCVWLQIITEISLSLPSEVNVNITTQKCLQATLLLLPLEEELLRSLVNALSQIAVKTTKTPLINMALQTLIKTFDASQKEKQLIPFLESCEPLYHMPQSSILIKTVLSADNIAKQNEITKLFVVLLNIKKSTSELDSFIDTKLVDLILFVTADLQIDFVKSNKLKLPVLLLLWSKYCNPENEETFSAEFSKNCFLEILSYLSFFVESGNIHVLEYIEKAKVPPQDFGKLKNCDRWHIHSLFHSLSKLLNDSRADIIDVAKRLINKVSEDMMLMLT